MLAFVNISDRRGQPARSASLLIRRLAWSAWPSARWSRSRSPSIFVLFPRRVPPRRPPGRHAPDAGRLARGLAGVRRLGFCSPARGISHPARFWLLSLQSGAAAVLLYLALFFASRWDGATAQLYTAKADGT